MNSPRPRPARSSAPLSNAGPAQTHVLLLFDSDPARATEWRARLAPLDCPVLVAHMAPAMLALVRRVPLGLVVCAAATDRLVEWLARHWLERAPIGRTRSRSESELLPRLATVESGRADRDGCGLAQDLHAQEQGQILAALRRFAGHRLRAAAHPSIAPNALVDRRGALGAASVVLPA